MSSWIKGWTGTFLLLLCSCGPQQKVVTLQSSSGETVATATFAEQENATEITIQLASGQDSAILQAHVHRDRCALRNEVLHVLNPFESGVSTTVVPVTLSELYTGRHALDAHRFDRLNTYAGCGEME